MDEFETAADHQPSGRARPSADPYNLLRYGADCLSKPPRCRRSELSEKFCKIFLGREAASPVEDLKTLRSNVERLNPSQITAVQRVFSNPLSLVKVCYFLLNMYICSVQYKYALNLGPAWHWQNIHN